MLTISAAGQLLLPDFAIQGPTRVSTTAEHGLQRRGPDASATAAPRAADGRVCLTVTPSLPNPSPTKGEALNLQHMRQKSRNSEIQLIQTADNLRSMANAANTTSDVTGICPCVRHSGALDFLHVP